MVVGDKVIQGVTASFVPRGGFILAIDLESGKEVWRFNTIARPGTPGGETWNDLPIDDRSGGSVWHQGTYDPELNLIFYGIAPTYDTGPLLNPVDKEGVTNDALYTNCTIALNPDTGELVWHYQHMPNDQWDLDWVFERQIVTIPVNGEPRKVVMNVGKMAILEALDASTGEYLFSVDMGVQNVITVIDPNTGAKTFDPDKMPDPERPCVICPSAFGARSWPPTSYSPKTKFLYVPLTEWCMAFGEEGMKLLSSGVGITSAPHPATGDGMMGKLQAVDVVNRKPAWSHDVAPPITTSVLSTAGGLVFSGDLEPSLKAFDDETGELLWQSALDDLPRCSVISYGVDERQYVAVVVGISNLHSRDLARTYGEFVSSRGDAAYAPPRGGAAIWVFAL
jgi:alcohol dehydrogenase (cytochrome c)